jgi:hypothetical protein
MTFMCACGYADTCNNPAAATKVSGPLIMDHCFNLSQTQRNLLDIRNQSVPRCKHFPLVKVKVSRDRPRWPEGFRVG